MSCQVPLEVDAPFVFSPNTHVQKILSYLNQLLRFHKRMLNHCYFMIQWTQHACQNNGHFVKVDVQITKPIGITEWNTLLWIKWYITCVQRLLSKCLIGEIWTFMKKCLTITIIKLNYAVPWQACKMPQKYPNRIIENEKMPQSKKVDILLFSFDGKENCNNDWFPW